MLSILCHFLLLMSFAVVLNFETEQQKSPALYVPSYVYHQPPIQPALQQQEQQQTAERKTVPTSTAGIEKNTLPSQQPAASASQSRPMRIPKDQQPVHMIGDKNVRNALLELLGKAFYAHLVYPRIAIDFHLRGVASVQFSVHPDGRITDVKLIKSSSAEILDQAAIDAISGASPVYNVGLYVKKPQSLVINVIFR